MITVWKPGVCVPLQWCHRRGAVLLAALMHSFPSSPWKFLLTFYSRIYAKKGQVYWLFIGLLMAFLILLPGVHQGRHLCTALTFSASWRNRDPLVLHWPSCVLSLGKTEIRGSLRMLQRRIIFFSLIKTPLEVLKWTKKEVLSASCFLCHGYHLSWGW